jgi:RNA polymerase sigma factor (sigma-70 family)
MPRNVRVERAELDAAAWERALGYLELADRLARRQFRRCGRTVPLEDLAGEARLALAYAASLYQEARGVPYGAYVTLVVRHWLAQAVTRWRRGGRLDHVRFTDLAGHGPGPKDSPFDPPCPRTREPGREAATREALDRVRRVLPPRWFGLLQLYFAQGCTLEEIGTRLGVSRERVRQLLGKALRRARRHCPDVPSGW